jgi:diamine N-acetyltransferase
MSNTTIPAVNLRAMEPEDLDVLYQIENTPELWSVSNTSVPYSRYVLHDYIANASNDIYTDRQVRLVIENAANEIVGMLDIVNFDPQHRRAEISIVIKNCYHGRGYASVAVSKAKDYSLRVLHLHQLYAIVSTQNEASLRLFTKLGFREGCVLNDWLYDGENYVGACVMQCLLHG